MSDLFEVNRKSLKKIFEIHQIRGLILFTDVLKICTATRVFPNLLNSKDLRILVAKICNVACGEELNARLGYKELEEFLRSASELAFSKSSFSNEQHKLFFQHIRNPCYLRYNLILETNSKEETPIFNQEKNVISLSPHRSYKRLNLSFIKSEKSKQANEVQESLQFSEQILTPTENNSKFPQKKTLPLQFNLSLKKYSEKVSEIFNHHSSLKGAKKISEFRNSFLDRQGKIKLCFNIWSRFT